MATHFVSSGSGDGYGEYRILVPQHFNDGRSVPPALRELIETTACDLFNGFTAARNLDGAWVDGGGRVLRDTNDEYRLASPEADKVIQFAYQVGVWLEQHAMYIRTPDNLVIIIGVGDLDESDDESHD